MLKLTARLCTYLCIFIISGLAGCTTFHKPTPPALTSKVSCLSPLNQLDVLAKMHAGTLIAQRIKGAPWLRTDRFLASFNQQQLTRQQSKALLNRMKDKAISGLITEAALIPVGQLKTWQDANQIRTSPASFIRWCSEHLVTEQKANPKQAIQWLQQLTVSDSYSAFQRIAGFYPIAAIPFRMGIVKEQETLRQESGSIQNKQWTAYVPVTKPAQNITVQKDALNIPLLKQPEARKILQQYAPTWLIDSETSANLPGTLHSKHGKLQVNISKPSTYTAISFGRWKHQVTTQLNYLIWFKEHPALHKFDWVAGTHDAVIFRVHLDAAQNILAYDSIHLCGCWYRLFLPPETSFKPRYSPESEPILMEHVDSAKHMQIYISHDTHQVIALKPLQSLPKKPRPYTYRLETYNKLLAIPAFNRQGYVEGSERPERWLFWPMGVKNPGALRRFGEHAISFIGKRHFDDPRLLEDIGAH